LKWKDVGRAKKGKKKSGAAKAEGGTTESKNHNSLDVLEREVTWEGKIGDRIGKKKENPSNYWEGEMSREDFEAYKRG